MSADLATVLSTVDSNVLFACATIIVATLIYGRFNLNFACLTFDDMKLVAELTRYSYLKCSPLQLEAREEG
jgi:hypothetical protein